VSTEHVVAIGFEHVPSPFAAHVVGAAHEGTEQHTASTQYPLVHCEGDVHDVPSTPVETHVVPLQKYPDAQSAGPEQLVLHVVEPHVYGVHEVEVVGLHAPRPLHVDAGVAAPAVQLAALQIVDDPGYAPHASGSDPLHCD
jgi:hypothetical protein